MSENNDRAPDCLGPWQLARLIARCSGTLDSKRVRRIIFAAFKHEIECAGCNAPLGVGGETCFRLHPQVKTVLVYHVACANGYPKLMPNDPLIVRWAKNLDLKLPSVNDALRHKPRKREETLTRRPECRVYRHAGR